MTKGKNKIFVVIILGCLTLNSCNDNPIQIKVFHSPDFQTPIVTGLRLTTRNGPNVVGIWRKPFDTDQCSNDTGQIITYNGVTDLPTTSYLKCPYPNPANGSILLEFTLASKSIVSCWIVPATLPENNTSFNQQYAGCSLPAPSGFAIDVLISQELQTGYYVIKWDNLNTPAGFYRVYLQVNELLFWRDVLLYRQKSDIPNDLIQSLPEGFPLFL